MGGCSSVEEVPPERMYGADLQQMQSDDLIDGLPKAIVEAARFLRADGRLEIQGVFRKSANAKKLQAVKDAYNAGEPVDYMKQGAVTTAANAFKAFFRDLRNPVIPCPAFGAVGSLIHQEDAEDKSAKMKDLLVEHLPAVHLTVLRAAVYFLFDVSEHHESNGMSLDNIAIVLGPNFLWPKGNAPNSGNIPKLNDVKTASDFLKFTIENREAIFSGLTKEGYIEATL